MENRVFNGDYDAPKFKFDVHYNKEQFAVFITELNSFLGEDFFSYFHQIDNVSGKVFMDWALNNGYLSQEDYDKFLKHFTDDETSYKNLISYLYMDFELPYAVYKTDKANTDYYLEVQNALEIVAEFILDFEELLELFVTRLEDINEEIVESYELFEIDEDYVAIEIIEY